MILLCSMHNKTSNKTSKKISKKKNNKTVYILGQQWHQGDNFALLYA